MNHSKRPAWFLVVTAVIFLAASAFFNAEVTQFSTVSPALKPQTMHAPMGGLENVVADVLWMRLVQFMGTSHDLSDQERARQIYNKFDRITRLDPKFYLAYKYGVLTLFVQSPQKALNLVDRGLKFMSAEEYDWQFPFYGAFICYQYSKKEGRYNRALKYLHATKECDSAPSFVRRFRPMILERQEELEEALEVWINLCRNADNPMDKHVVQNHLERIANKIIEADVSPSLHEKARAALKKIGAKPAGENGDE